MIFPPSNQSEKSKLVKAILKVTLTDFKVASIKGSSMLNVFL